MAKAVKVEWYKQVNSLNEIYQQTGMLFSFVTSPAKGLKQCHQWVKCRDYLHDAVRAVHTGKDFRIYGFFYDPKKNPHTDLKKMRMLVTKAGMTKADLVKFKKAMKNGLLLLNHYEGLMGAGLSKVQEVNADKDKHVWMFTGPKVWMNSPSLVSMYTFLIRLGVKEIKFKDNKELRDKLEALSKSQHADNDTSYLTSMWSHLDWVAKNYKKYLIGKDGIDDIYNNSTVNIDRFHNNAGIKSLIDCCSPLPERNNVLEKLLKKTK